MPHALRAAGAQVEAHADHFLEDALDEAWLAAAGANGWVVITRDKAIRHRATELAALKAARVSAFVLMAKRLTGPQNGAILAKALPRMLRFLIGNRPPFIAGVTPTSRLVMLFRGRRPRERGSGRRAAGAAGGGDR